MGGGAFERELMRRSPLAACVLEVGDYLFDDALLASVWEANRGRCYEDVLGFGQFLRLTRDALLCHGGSAHALFVDLERDGRRPVDESNFYRKLSRTPAKIVSATPELGTHTDEILTELGLNRKEIDALRAKGAI